MSDEVLKIYKQRFGDNDFYITGSVSSNPKEDE